VSWSLTIFYPFCEGIKPKLHVAPPRQEARGFRQVTLGRGHCVTSTGDILILSLLGKASDSLKESWRRWVG